MGMIRMFFPSCDECGGCEDDYTDARSARVREAMKADGWKVSGGRFVCPDCVGIEEERKVVAVHRVEPWDEEAKEFRFVVVTD